MHCFYSDRFLITLHRDDAPSLAALRERYIKRDAPVDDPARLLHEVVDGLVDSFFPRLTAIDDRIDVLEDSIFRNADDAQLQEIFSMKRALVSMRKVISPQRDLFSSIVTGVENFPGMTDDDQRYFRDVYDHLIRIGDMVDTYRDLLTGRDGRLPLDRLEPAQRRHEAARDHRHGLHAAHVPDRVLRSEPRLDGGARRRPRALPRLRDRARADDARDRAHVLPPRGLAQPVSPGRE